MSPHGHPHGGPDPLIRFLCSASRDALVDVLEATWRQREQCSLHSHPFPWEALLTRFDELNARLGAQTEAINAEALAIDNLAVRIANLPAGGGGGGGGDVGLTNAEVDQVKATIDAQTAVIEAQTGVLDALAPSTSTAGDNQARIAALQAALATNLPAAVRAQVEAELAQLQGQ